MSKARIEADGKVVALDGRSEPDEVVTEDDAKDPGKVARLLARLLKDVASLKRLRAPRFIDFEDIVVGAAGAIVQVEHGFGGRVRWWLVGWQPVGTVAAILKEDAAKTTTKTLVLASYVAGVATIRVESAG